MKMRIGAFCLLVTGLFLLILTAAQGMAAEEKAAAPSPIAANAEAPVPPAKPPAPVKNMTVQIRARQNTRLDFTSDQLTVVVLQKLYNLPADEREAPTDPIYINGDPQTPAQWEKETLNRVRYLTATPIAVALKHLDYQIKIVNQSLSREKAEGGYRCLITFDETPDCLSVNITGPRDVDVWVTLELVPRPFGLPGPWKHMAGNWIINMGMEVSVTIDDQGIIYRDGIRLGYVYKARAYTFFNLDSGRLLVFKEVAGLEPMPARTYHAANEYPDGEPMVASALVRRGRSL